MLVVIAATKFKENLSTKYQRTYKYFASIMVSSYWSLDNSQ
jgi:hypothetical protein